MSHADRYLLFNQTKQAKSASGDLSLTSFIKIAWIFLPFTTKKRSHMKHERTEGQQTQFIKEKIECECTSNNFDYHTSK